MALNSYVLVFSTQDVDKPDEFLPSEEDILESFREWLNIPDTNVTVQLWAVAITGAGYEAGLCRKCGVEVEEERLFCATCSSGMVQASAIEEAPANPKDNGQMPDWPKTS